MVACPLKKFRKGLGMAASGAYSSHFSASPGARRALFASLTCAAIGLVPAAHARGLARNLDEQELVEYLETGSEQARAEACDRLGKRRSASALALVGKRVLEDGSPRVRKQCLQALAAIGHADGARFARRAALGDADESVRLEALATFSRLAGEAPGVELLAAVLKGDGPLRVRREAAQLLGRRRWVSALPALAKVARSDAPRELRRECLEALFETRDRRAYAAIHEILLGDPSLEMRREAASRLERHPDLSSLEPLCKVLQDSDERLARSAAEGLYRLGSRKAVPALREAASKSSDRLARYMNKVADKLDR